MSEKYQPLPYKDGNRVIKEYREEFEDSIGNKATLRKVDFWKRKKNGGMTLVTGHVMQVIWHGSKKES